MNAPATAADLGRVDADTGEITHEVDSDFERLLNKQGSARTLLLDGSSFDKIMRIAEAMADGASTMPKHLQGKLGDCVAVATQAMQWDMNPFAVAQKTHVVNGTLGYEAQLVNAVVQKSGAIRGHFHYEHRGEGNSLETRAGAVLRGDEEITWTEWLSVNAPKVKNSPLWQTNPKQQLGYLQVKNWARAYAPGAILGVYTADELEDSEPEQPRPKGPQRKSAAAPTPPATPAAPAAQTADASKKEAKPEASAPASATPAGAAGGIAGGQVAYLRNKLKSAEIAEQTICDRFQVTGIELLSAEQFDTVKAELLAL